MLSGAFSSPSSAPAEPFVRSSMRSRAGSRMWLSCLNQDLTAESSFPDPIAEGNYGFLSDRGTDRTQEVGPRIRRARDPAGSGGIRRVRGVPVARHQESRR